jgi:hypothetical protein
MAQAVEHLLCKHKALNSKPSPKKILSIQFMDEGTDSTNNNKKATGVRCGGICL